MLWCFQTGYCTGAVTERKKSRETWRLQQCFFFFVNRKEPVVLVVPLPGPGTSQERVEVCACSSECRVKGSIAFMLLSWHNSI